MRVLVIEDNSDIATNIGDYLEDRGHVVDFAGTASRACIWPWCTISM